MIKNKAEKHPVIFSLLTAAVFYAALKMAGTILNHVGINDVFVKLMIYEGIVAAVALSYLLLVGNAYIFERNQSFGHFMLGIRAGIYFCVLSTIVLSYSMLEYLNGGIEGEYIYTAGPDIAMMPPFHILAFIFYMFFIGVAEEFAFRGVVSELMLKKFGSTDKGIRCAAVSTGVIFGMMHLVNAADTGIVSALVQAITVSFMGVALTTVYYISGNIWAIVFVHALNDFAIMAFNGGIFGYPDSVPTDSMTYDWTNLIAVLPYLVLIFIMLRRGNMAKVRKNMHLEPQAQDHMYVHIDTAAAPVDADYTYYD